MNYFEIVNKCLAEMNCRQVSQWGELTRTHHINIKEAVNRVNAQVCMDEPWEFLETSTLATIPANSWQITPDFDGRLDSIIIGNELYTYTSNYLSFLLGRFCERQFAMYSGKIFVKPAQEAREAIFLYYSNNFAKDVDGTPKDMLEFATDESVIPEAFAEPILVYGTCMRVKHNPNLPKFNYWYKEYHSAYAELRAKGSNLAQDSPLIKISRI